MACLTIRGGIPTAPVPNEVIDNAYQGESPMMDNPNAKQRTPALASTFSDQHLTTAEYSAILIPVPVSPRTSNELSASAAASTTSTGSVTGKYNNINHKYYVCPGFLGTGSSGSVRRCVDRTTNQSYAVKSIRKCNPKDKLEGLACEITLLQEMDHRIIIRLVDVFEDAEYLHLVTDLCEGGELFDRIASKSSADNGATCFPEDEAARSIHQILISVSYMHGLGIVHRDIKPENILFETTDDDSPMRIIDFGLARKHLEHREPPMDKMVSTAFYMAPEVLKRNYDKSCDLWSVGVIAYTLLCGYPPFNGSNDVETYRAVLRGRYFFSSEDWNAVSSEARNFVNQLLQMDPKRRMTAEQALNHPWLAKYSNKMVEDNQRGDVSVKHAHVIKGSRMPTKRPVLRGGIALQNTRKPKFEIASKFMKF